MEEVALGDLGKPASVEVCLVEMLVIRILVRIPSVGCEIYRAGLLVHLQDFLHMPRSLGDAVLQIALVIVQVKMGPAVAFAPVDKLLSAC